MSTNKRNGAGVVAPRAASKLPEGISFMVVWNKYTPEQRNAAFWARVAKSSDADGCWLWTAYCDKGGYGRLSWDGKTRGAHQVSWELANGEIPDGQCVLHNCPSGDNPRCVNPVHLWLGTKSANSKDRDQKGRTATGIKSGKHTHPESIQRGSRNGRAKLTEAQVVEIRRRYSEGGISHAKLGKEYGVGHETINLIVNGRTWLEARS